MTNAIVNVVLSGAPAQICESVVASIAIIVAAFEPRKRGLAAERTEDDRVKVASATAIIVTVEGHVLVAAIDRGAENPAGRCVAHAPEVADLIKPGVVNDRQPHLDGGHAKSPDATPPSVKA